MADATAPAQKIVITDTLDTDLDLSTFELAEIAFADQTMHIPAGLNHYEVTGAISPSGHSLLVDVDAALDLDTRKLTVTLMAVEPTTGWLAQDPLLGMLYPNDASGRGSGYVSYLVRPMAGLPSATSKRHLGLSTPKRP